MSDPAITDNATPAEAPQSNPEERPAELSASANTVEASNIDSSKVSSSLRSTRRISSVKKRRSSLFERARASFYRSRGQSGASVETLRGTTGSDFEGYALVERCSAEEFAFNCNPFSFCCGSKDGKYFLLIKGYHCFVFKDEEGIAPKFAVELNHRNAVVQPADGVNHSVVHLETSLGDIEYKFTFSKSHLDENDTVATPAAKASAFAYAVSAAASAAQTEEVRTRLGHQNLLNKRSSVRYANTIGKVKTKEQPEAPVGMGEVMNAMPVNGPM
jgi:hypothetical protein